jgi:FkbM family methyltransferase
MEKYKEFHGQFGEDKLLRTKPFQDYNYKGVFVDIGAGHPVKFSNTYHFEKNGWTGLCVDGDQRQINELFKFRKCQVFKAVVSGENLKRVNFLQAGQPDLSRKVEKKDGPIISFSLDYILRKFKIEKIDLLSIDVEGDELEILKSFDIKKYLPGVIIVEFLSPGKNQEKEIKDFFNSISYDVKYDLMAETNSNLIFKKI